MVRLKILIGVILSIFILNACGNTNPNMPANVDNRDAILFKKGTYTGRAQSVMVPEFKEDGEVFYREQEQLFDNHPEIHVDWEEKKVLIKTKYLGHPKDAKNKSKPEAIVLEGKFNDEGIAYLKPKDNKEKFIAGVTCSNQCRELVIDMGVNLVIDGKPELLQQQFTEEVEQTIEEKDKVDEKLEDREEINKNVSEHIKEMEIEEIDPNGSNLKSSSKTNTNKSKNSKADFSGVRTTISNRSNTTGMAEMPEMTEPGTPAPRPSVLRKEMKNLNENDIKLAEYISSRLFPLDLGEKYSGKADGFYSRKCRGKGKSRRCYGVLLKGTDVAIYGNKSTERRVGFSSVDRSDKVHYGSGLLVKTIEEAGQTYSMATQGDYFEVNDTSKKAGGRVWPHSSHQNGLDADISLPKLKNGKFDQEKVWMIVKAFVNLGYVDVIFLNKSRIRDLCQYLKSSNEKNYQKIFHKLYPESGHTTHMHVRLQCTGHNIGCIPAKYTESKRAVCK